MTPVSIASVAASLLSLVLSVWFVITSLSASSMQKSALERQQELTTKQKAVGVQENLVREQNQKIQQAQTMNKQYGSPIVQGIAQLAVQKNNQKLLALLKKHGFNIQATPTPAGPAASKPTPTPPPTPGSAPGL